MSETRARRFSHSLVSTYLDCPKKAMYRYIEEAPARTGAALVMGSACDEAWTYALQRKIETGENLDAGDVKDLAEQSFRDRVYLVGGTDEVDWGEDGSPRKSLDTALRMAETWARDLQPHIQPDAVQVEYHRPLPSGRDFIAFIDWEGEVAGYEGKVVGDHKTGKRRMDAGKVDRELQPFAYGYAKGEAIGFVFDRAIDTGRTVSSEFVWTQRSVEDTAWYGNVLDNVERGFEAGVFPANPSSLLCGKFCPYLERCMPSRTIHSAS